MGHVGDLSQSFVLLVPISIPAQHHFLPDDQTVVIYIHRRGDNMDWLERVVTVLCFLIYYPIIRPLYYLLSYILTYAYTICLTPLMAVGRTARYFALLPWRFLVKFEVCGGATPWSFVADSPSHLGNSHIPGCGIADWSGHRSGAVFNHGRHCACGQ